MAETAIDSLDSGQVESLSFIPLLKFKFQVSNEKIVDNLFQFAMVESRG